MDTILKGLVAAASVAIIAAVSYAGWLEYSRISLVRAIDEAERMRKEREVDDAKFAGRLPCIAYLDGLRSYDLFESPNVQWSEDHLIREVRACRDDDRLTSEQVAPVAHML